MTQVSALFWLFDFLDKGTIVLLCGLGVLCVWLVALFVLRRRYRS